MTKSSGNIFADLGVKNAKEYLVKTKLAFIINQIIAKRNLTQVLAGEILKINQPKISALANCRLAGFSIERLIGFLNKLDQDVEIVIHEKPKNRKKPSTFSVVIAL